jgi:hypothetical protein
MSVEALDLNVDLAIAQPSWSEAALDDLRDRAVTTLFKAAAYLESCENNFTSFLDKPYGLDRAIQHRMCFQ